MTTTIIELHVMVENDADKLNTYLSEVPKSTQLSTYRDSETKQIMMRDNLLQVCVKDRIIIFDLKPEVPQEVCFFNATNQFIDPHAYVETGIKIVHCEEDPSKEKDGHLVTQIVTNRNQDICFIRQERRILRRSIKYEDIAHTFICLGVFKKYAEIDLQELARIQSKIANQQKLDNIDMQTALCTFDSHTVFSIFADSVKFHEQMLEQINESEFAEEEQDDETMLENNVLRRLYRVLTLPTPDINLTKIRSREDHEDSDNEENDQPGEGLEVGNGSKVAAETAQEEED